MMEGLGLSANVSDIPTQQKIEIKASCAMEHGTFDDNGKTSVERCSSIIV